MSYTLGCVLVAAHLWPDVFDDMIDYRRFLRTNFGIPVRAEIKANYLIRNGGPHLSEHPIGEDARYRVYRGFMRLTQKLELKVFGVVVRKDILKARGVATDPREIAWDWMLQRLERFSTKSAEPLLLVHDEGDTAMIRKATRRARRAGIAGSAFGTSTLRRPARLIIDDPVPRQSHNSYFIQLADLVAYAAFRYIYPPGKRVGRVVPQDMWEELGTARYRPVSSFAGGPPGLVVGPSA